jgi:subtilisin family serine protease
MSIVESLIPGAASDGTYVPGQIIIQFGPGLELGKMSEVLSGIGAVVSEVLRQAAGDVGALTLANLPANLDPAMAAKLLSLVPGVSFAEPNYVLSIDAVATDPAYSGGQLWGMEGDQTSPANAYGSQAGEAWAAGNTGSTKMGVGVIDTGIDYRHQDLYRNIWLNQNEIPGAFKTSLQDTDGDGLITFRDLNASANAAFVTDKNGNSRIDAGDLLNDTRWENGVDDDGNGFKDDLVGWDFVNNDNDPYDDNSHGTHVSGTIAATPNDGGVVGVNWAAELVALKFLNAQGSGTSANAIKALDYLTGASKAGTAVDFVASNNSWGGDAFSQAMLDAIVRAAKQDILFVAAAGNGGSDGVGDNNNSTPYYPSSYSTLNQGGLTYDAVISVAAITSTGAMASFSNYGISAVDIGAPGNSIYSTMPNGGYGTKSGTSMAAPHVTGALALYSAAVGAGVSADAIKQALLASAAPTASLLDKVLSDGRLDLGKLLGAPADTTPPTATAAITDALDNAGAVTGPVANGGATDDVTPQLRGTLSGALASDEIVRVYRDGAVAGQASVSGSDWTFQDGTVSGGAHTWAARVVDAAGNVGPATGDFSLSITAPSLIYGKQGSDTVTGTAGPDKIWGVSAATSDVGRGAVDVLTGGTGGDTFVLGDARGRFYDDGWGFSAGTGDYARITDFNSAEGDKIQLAGAASRWLQHVVTIGGTQGLGIYYDSNGGGTWNSSDELVGFLPGKSSLLAGDFVFV